MSKRPYKLISPLLKELTALHDPERPGTNPLVRDFWQRVGKAMHLNYRTVEGLDEDGNFYAEEKRV